jgi:predicted transcriptional regulator
MKKLKINKEKILELRRNKLSLSSIAMVAGTTRQTIARRIAQYNHSNKD